MVQKWRKMGPQLLPAVEIYHVADGNLNEKEKTRKKNFQA